MDPAETERLKQRTLIALFSDDQLVHRLVLKGGNALSLAYGLMSRASFDLDFSMEGQFDSAELPAIRGRIETRLIQAFAPIGYAVFDVRLEQKPENITPDLEVFWGGYNLEFRLVRRERYDELHGDLTAIRREALKPRPRGKARFEVDISRHEYCEGKQPVEIDFFTVFVYTPLMVVCEKIRAICQQMPRYAATVKKHQAPRARDFFDIHQTVQQFRIDILNDESVELLKKMFQAKRVPAALLASVRETREFHRQDWDAVRDTVDPGIKLREFDYYFAFVAGLCDELAIIVSD